MASAHSALIAFILKTSKQLPFAGRCHLRKLQSGKVKVGNRYIDLGEADWPDVCGFGRLGQWVSIECKVGRDKLSSGQAQMRDKILATELGQWHLVTSETEAIAALEAICL